MDRLFFMLAVVLALAVPSSAGEKAQPVFFSLLFPQLVPGYEEAQTAPSIWDEWCFGEAVEL